MSLVKFTIICGKQFQLLTITTAPSCVTDLRFGAAFLGGLILKACCVAGSSRLQSRWNYDTFKSLVVSLALLPALLTFGCLKHLFWLSLKHVAQENAFCNSRCYFNTATGPSLVSSSKLRETKYYRPIKALKMNIWKHWYQIDIKTMTKM